MSCVNTSSGEFKSLLNDLDISSGTLEMVLHKMQNEGALENRAYPTASEIISRLSPKPFEASLSKYKEDNKVSLWLTEYLKPHRFSENDLNLKEYVDKAVKIYGKDSVNTIELKNGYVAVQVGRPSFLPVNINQGMFYELKSLDSSDSRDILLRDTIEALERIGLPHINATNSTKENPYTKGKSIAEATPFEVNLYLPTFIENLYQWRHIKGASGTLFKSKIHHELEHSITLSTFRKVEAGRGTAEEVKFYNEMDRLWNLAKEVLKDNNAAGLDYFRNSIDEFVAEIISNQKLQRELSKHKDPKSKRNILHSIIDAIANFFNKNFGLNIKGSILESSLIELNKFHSEVTKKDEPVQSKPGYTSEVIDKLVKNQEKDPYGIRRYRKGGITTTTYIVHTPSTNEGRKIAESKIQGYEDLIKIGKYNSKFKGYEVIRKVTQETIDKRNATRKKNAELREQQIAEALEKEYEEQISYEELLEEEQRAWKQEKSDHEEYLLDILASKDSSLYNQVLEGTMDLYDAIREYEKLNDNSIYAPSSSESSLPFYEGNIEPTDDTIFVFGSNLEGRHGAGAAKIAREQFGAIYGLEEGLQGNAYALPTKDLRVKENKSLRSIPPEQIIESIKKLYETAKQYPNDQFKVAYRNINKASLSGYTGLEMIEMFKKAGSIPTNIVFSKEWVDTGLLTKDDYIRKHTQEENQIKYTEPHLKNRFDINPFTTVREVNASLAGYFEGGGANIFRDFPNATEADVNRLENYYMGGKEFDLTDTQVIELGNKILGYNPLNQKNSQQEQTKQDLYTTKQQDKMQQIDNLLGDNLLSATEVRHIAEQAVYWISDHITELQENPELAKTIYGDRFKNEDGTDKDFASMTRADVVRTVGVDNIVEMCKQKFSPEHNEFDDFDTIDKATAITDNWQAIMLLAQDSFLNLEDFSIVSTPDGKANEVNEDLVGNADNFNESNEQSDVEEVEGNLQEHWQIESRCQDVLGTMSQMVRRALLKCYVLDENGNNIQSEFGINERINVRESTNSILRWTQGALNLADMVTKLQEKQESNPWVKQLVDRLSDTTGKETDFQGQFYGTFCKHFQPYSVVIEEDGKYKSIQVNENPALSEAMTQVTTQYKIGEHPLFTTEGINKESFKELKESYESLEKFKHSGYDLSKEVNKEEAANTLGYISNLFGYYVTPDMVKSNLTPENYRKMYSALYYMVNSLENNLDNAAYEPFTFKAKDSINGNMREFLKPITDHLEDTAVSAFYDSGKMYQSYVTPSYMSKLMQKFSQKGEAFDKFMMEEYGNFAWFHEGTDIERGWRNSWLEALATDSKAREIFKHKVQLNFNKHNYMRNMNDMEYTLSLFTEYFSEGANDKQSRVPAWFRVPMLSNKPSSEFIRFYSERGINYKETITEGMMNIFNQELSRIQTVKMRNLDSKDPRFIKSFDKNGKKFCFLDFMNDYLTGDKKSSELGKLLNDKVEGKKIDDAKLYELANKAIFNVMDAKAKSITEDWIKSGLLEGAKKIVGIGTTEEEIKSNLENFVWNDTFAAMNIMEMTVTDIAYYKNAEDLQKRLAQIHAPGIRGNVHAVDYEGKAVTDGKERTFYLTDWDNFISNVIENVSIVFDRKIAEAPEYQKASLRALKESLVGKNGAYKNINVADAQGYSSPSSYRKKALIFGKWSKKAEDIYQKLKKGDYTYNDLSIAFQPLKPFVYGQIEKSSGVENAPLDTFKVPVQNKNSEYLLIMADAILQNEHTGRPNLLRAIYEVMEESHYDENGNYKTNGIDTVQFESTVKSGLMGRINLNKYVNDVNGEAKAKAVMEACLYETTPTTVQEFNEKTGEMEDVTINTKTGKYSETYVHELPFEDYCLQQEVPEHFKNHEQVHGSQLRYIVVSELATKDSFGNDATYEVEGKKLSAEEFKAEYEQTVADNIEGSISELSSTLNLDSYNAKDRNIALSKILQREILSSPRYGVDLLQACSVDENGRFRIPLGDPIQSKRVEQLINSIIKNRVNKQEIAGGPVVQVTNFGTSRELNIRFKDKDGNLLKTRKEFKGTDEEFKQYLKENQGGIAYFEVFAPIYANNLFSQFADKDGNISIEAIEALDPDLLKMIGYRIPTEAKYSMAPLKIVGFLPREAGDGIMLPNDITLLTGSDFDVDKEYLMRKDYGISRNKTTKSALHKVLYDSLVESQNGKLSYKLQSNLHDLVRMFLDNPFDKASFVNQKTTEGYMSMSSSAYNKLLKLYVQNAFTVEKPTEGRTYRNNKIVDMTYEVLTHETSCAEMLNPGGFDPQKRMGYLVTALKTTNLSYEELSKMSIDELKNLTDKDKNLMFIDTHVQFYKQNSAAGSLIGMFAVNRTAHAVIENEGYMLNVDNACNITEPFIVADMIFGGNMPIDVRFDRTGQSVGKVLGSLVASAADAVKDPVLNLMNINSNTANILNTLVRLGMPFDDAALFLSQNAISQALTQFSSENITGFTSLSKVIDSRIKAIEKEQSLDENSPIQHEELTKEELIKGVKSNDPRIEYKVLKSFRKFQSLADAMRMPTFATRFNSISSAVGPLIIDNLITEHKMMKLSSESNILGSNGEEVSMYDIFSAHPILNQFRKTLGIAQSLFGNMPTNSNGFRNTLDYISELPIGETIFNDRKLLSNLSDFYQSYLCVAGGVIDSKELSKTISEFPKEFMKKEYKKQYSDNFLIQSIKYGTDKGGRATLQIDITGLNTQQKEMLSSAWIDLHKANPALSEQLFKYCFFRAGIGFSPKTFMALVPVYVKERLSNYVDTFRVLPSSTPEIVFDQFVRNNWDNNKLVPRKNKIALRTLEDGNVEVYRPSEVNELRNTQYFKMKVDGKDILYQQVLEKENSIEYKEIEPLGNNKDYLEISTEGIDKPLNIPTEAKEEGSEKSEVETPVINQEEQLNETSQTEQEKIDLLHQIYMTGNKTFEDADKTIQGFKAMDEGLRNSLKPQIKTFMKSRLETLGIEHNDETIEKEYNKLC